MTYTLRWTKPVNHEEEDFKVIAYKCEKTFEIIEDAEAFIRAKKEQNRINQVAYGFYLVNEDGETVMFWRKGWFDAV